jgi:hypothetical protein
MAKFKPKTATEYICSGCVGKRGPTRAPEPELESHWRPGKDAPSLTGDSEGLGSTLAGSDFRVHR